jgi:mercuric ion binding protein
MSIFKILGPLVIAFLIATPALAGEQTATLKVEGMTCASCPYQVKKSLTGVDGVKAAEVSLDTKLATVTFDNEKTDIAALTAATAGAGFPSSPVQ